MKAENIISALGEISDKYVKEAEYAPKRQKSKRRKGFIVVGSALTAAAAVALMILSPWNRSEIIAPYAVAYAEYPESLRDPVADGFFEIDEEYRSYSTARHGAISDESREKLLDFCVNVSGEFLAGKGNRAYSPLNVYAALGMLSELTGGETRSQILELAGADSKEQLSDDISGILKANYRDEGLTTSIPANSIWLGSDIDYSADPLKTLAEKYYASSFYGTMGDEEYNEMYRGWINDMTGGLLSEQISDYKLSKGTTMSLVSTLYFHSTWIDKFHTKYTAPAVFHTPNGDISCDFMNESGMAVRSYYKGENFALYRRSFSRGGEMCFYLPDEGVSVNEMLGDKEFLDMLAGKELPDEMYRIEVGIPKFDVTSSLRLNDALKALGMTDAFDMELADFSPLTKAKAAATSATQEVRITVDENGVTAASAFELVSGMGGTDQEARFVLDRPFVYEIVSDTGCPLFVGVVENPLG